MADTIKIAGVLDSVTTEGILAKTSQLYDDVQSKFQEEINQDFNETLNNVVSEINTNINEAITEIQNTINNLDISTYKGLATPTTNPETGSAGIFYAANEAGTYSNFGGVTVKEGSAILYYDGGSWTVHQIMEAMDSDEITETWNDIVGGGVTEPEVTYVTITINATPSNATITMNGTVQSSITVPQDTQVTYKVECDGYQTVERTITATVSQTINVTLELDTVTITINPTPSDATVTINGTVQNSITVTRGTSVTYKVEKDGYNTVENTITATATQTINVVLEATTVTITVVCSNVPDAEIVINEEERSSITVDIGTEITWSVEHKDILVKLIHLLQQKLRQLL